MWSPPPRAIAGLVLLLLSLVHVQAVRQFQPIGIDFGPDLITASYAHSPDNISVLATIHPLQDDAYTTNMLHARLEYFKKKDLAKLYGNMSIGHLIVEISRLLFRKATSYLTFLDNPSIRDSTVLEWTGNALGYIFKTGLNILGFRDSFSDLDELSSTDFKTGLVSVLKELKKTVRQEHGISTRSAIISVPDFFNKTLTDLVTKACLQAGINTIQPIPRTVAAMFTPTFGIENDESRYLVIEHSQYYLDLRAGYDGQDVELRKAIHRGLPMDPYGSVSIDRQLSQRLVRSSDMLKFQIEIGADPNELWHHVGKARFLIKDSIDAEVFGDGVGEDHHFDEYPIDLSSWSMEEELDGVVLRWEDVQAVEDEYVKTLGNNVFTFFAALRQTRDPEKANDEGIPEDIDRVLILSSQHDVRLVQRAVRRALGAHVEIIGGALHDFNLAAIGAARGALRRRDAWSGGEPKQCKESRHNEL